MNMEHHVPPESVSETEIATFLRKEAGKEGDENNPAAFTLRGRLDALSAEARAALLASPVVVDFYRDRILLASRANVPPSLGTLKDRLDKSVPPELVKTLLASPQVFNYYRDNLVLAEREGTAPSASTVAERIKHLPVEIRMDMARDPKVRERFPDIGSRLGE